MKILPISLTSLVLMFSSQTLILAEHEVRTWIDKFGREFEGKLVDFDENMIVIEMSWSNYEVPLSIMSERDQAYIRELLRQADSGIRKWTGKDGREFKGELVDYDEDTIIIETRWHRYEVPLTDLIESDEAYVRELLKKDSGIRNWTHKNGRRIEARLVDFNRDTIVLEMDSVNFEVPLSDLVDSDQNYVGELIREREMKEGEEARLRSEREAWQQRLDTSLLKISDFRPSFGSSVGWSGSGGHITLEEYNGVRENVWRVLPHRNRAEIFGQNFTLPSNVSSIKVTVLHKASVYYNTFGNGLGPFSLWLHPSQGDSISVDREIQASIASWDELTVTFENIDSADQYRFEIAVEPGAGEIYFRGILIEPLP